MGTRDPRVDAYIARSAEFAQPILTHLRDAVHAACPDCEETIKWGAPCFTHHGMLGMMAAFKEHCAFNFWKASMIDGLQKDAGDAAGQFGRITSVKELPSKKVFSGYVKEAMRLNEEGVGRPKTKSAKPEPKVPADLAAALAKNRKAKAAFDGFSPSHRREYVEWVVEAKREETRVKRVAQAVEWMAEGKTRMWKYERS